VLIGLGHQYQGFDVRYNYIAYNDVEHRNIISAFGIQLNFTTNIVFANRAQCILNASVLEKVVFVVTILLLHEIDHTCKKSFFTFFILATFFTFFNVFLFSQRFFIFF